jgi:exodeoxyribonuclease VII small subunit
VTDERPFEELQRALEEIVQRLERGDVAVDEVIALWQEGDALYRECARRLETVELRIEELGISPPRDDRDAG